MRTNISISDNVCWIDDSSSELSHHCLLSCLRHCLEARRVGEEERREKKGKTREEREKREGDEEKKRLEGRNHLFITLLSCLAFAYLSQSRSCPEP